MDSINKKSPNRPVAPPAYRPQPVPKVLQKKSALVSKPETNQATRKPVAPPVYRPEVKKTLQPKVIAPPPPKPITATAAHRPGQQGIVQRQMPFKPKSPP